MLKFELKGQQSHPELQRICTANIKHEKGRTTYTQMLNSDGGIESDLTVVCLDKNYFRIVSCCSCSYSRQTSHTKTFKFTKVQFKDVTEDYACLGLFGPKSRDLITEIAGNYFKTKDFPFANGKNISIEGIKIWAQRLSYVGELGWELYIPVTKKQRKFII